MAGLIVKLTQDRLTEEKQNLVSVHAGLIEMESKKWPGEFPGSLVVSTWRFHC